MRRQPLGSCSEEQNCCGLQAGQRKESRRRDFYWKHNPQDGETHIGLGALDGTLIVGATLAGYDLAPATQLSLCLWRARNRPLPNTPLLKMCRSSLRGDLKFISAKVFSTFLEHSSFSLFPFAQIEITRLI